LINSFKKGTYKIITAARRALEIVMARMSSTNVNPKALRDLFIDVFN
jgi:hypothetical protein